MMNLDSLLSPVPQFLLTQKKSLTLVRDVSLG